jgi:hypothetical protein
MRKLIVTLVLLISSAPCAFAAEATFLGKATYATSQGCAQVAQLAAGRQRNLNSVPETLTAKGYLSWEGGCRFDKITPIVANRSWVVTTSCSEGAEENVKSTETWTKAADGSIMVNAGGKKTRFVACAAPKAK